MRVFVIFVLALALSPNRAVQGVLTSNDAKLIHVSDDFVPVPLPASRMIPPKFPDNVIGWVEQRYSDGNMENFDKAS
jgi:hypothetical protein